jgi:hypothetical protein
MMIDENDYFGQATVRNCGTLDIEVAPQNCLQYLAGFIPVSQITLSPCESVRCGIRGLAAVTHDEIKKPPDPMFLSGRQ